MIGQETLAKELGVVIASGNQKLFNTRLKTAKEVIKGKTAYGTWKFTLPQALKKLRVPLSVKRFAPSKIKDVRKFLEDNLKNGHDTIVPTNITPFSDQLILDITGYVHSMVICAIRTKNGKTSVKLGDPAYMAKKFIWVDLGKVLAGMSKEFGKEKKFIVFSGV